MTGVKYKLKFTDGGFVSQDDVPRSLAYNITNPSDDDVIRFTELNPTRTLQEFMQDLGFKTEIIEE